MKKSAFLFLMTVFGTASFATASFAMDVPFYAGGSASADTCAHADQDALKDAKEKFQAQCNQIVLEMHCGSCDEAKMTTPNHPGHNANDNSSACHADVIASGAAHHCSEN